MQFSILRMSGDKFCFSRLPVRRGPRLKQLMENKSASQSVLICLFGVLTFAVCTLPALGQTCEPTTTWTGSTGDWFTDGNWDNPVPCSTTDAYINNGGGAQINAYAVAHSLTLGQYAGNGCGQRRYFGDSDTWRPLVSDHDRHFYVWYDIYSFDSGRQPARNHFLELFN